MKYFEVTISGHPIDMLHYVTRIPRIPLNRTLLSMLPMQRNLFVLTELVVSRTQSASVHLFLQETNYYYYYLPLGPGVGFFCLGGEGVSQGRYRGMSASEHLLDTQPPLDTHSLWTPLLDTHTPLWIPP